ncbi:MAG: tetratricopeptide repeat protein [Candidatus Cloacimonetes bacterium]|nr:tetratricopeptide repeat protein [Candidatus Cloacimonadota bacterium]
MDYKEKLESLQEALSQKSDSKKKFIIFNKIIQLYREKGNYKEILETYYAQSQFCIEQIKKSVEKKYWEDNLAESYIYRNFIFMDLHNNKKAINLLQKAYRILKKTNNIRLLGINFIGFGFIQTRIKNYQKAREYFIKALNYLHQAKDNYYLNTVYNELANTFYYENDLQKSVEYHKKAIDISNSIGKFATFALLDLGSVYVDLNEFEKAFDCFQQVLDNITSIEIVTYANVGLAELFLKKTDFHIALKYCKLALGTANKLKNSSSLSRIHDYFSQIYEKLHKYDLALKHYKKYINYSYLTDNVEMNNKIAAIQINFDWEQKQKEIEIYHIKNNELEKVNSELKNHQKHLQMINKILRKDIFYDLKTIKNNLDDFKYKKDDSHLVKIESTLKESTNLIYHIRELETFLDTHTNLNTFIINDVINDVIQDIDFAVFEKSTPIKILAEDKIKLMFKLLIDNMIQIRNATRIIISLSKIKDNCKISIQDNGIDIAKDSIDLFLSNDYHQNEENLDLVTIINLVEESGGFIFFDKNESDGYTFTIVLRSID